MPDFAVSAAIRAVNEGAPRPQVNVTVPVSVDNRRAPEFTHPMFYNP